MYLISMHMVNETTGWGVGEPEDHEDLMGTTPEWSIFHTTDGGSDWKVVKTWDFSLGIIPFFLSEATAWIAINHHLIHTSNAGILWDEFALPLAAGESAQVTHLTFLDVRIGWLIAQIYSSSAPPKSDPLTVLYHTNNGGTSWNQLLRISEQSWDNGWGKRITFLTATTGWMTSGSLLLTTRDGGRTWQPQTLPLPAGVGSFSDLRFETPRFFSAQDGIISACRSNLHDSTLNGFVVFVTHDGGQNWQSQPFVLKDYNQVYEKRYQMLLEKKVKEMKEVNNGETTFWFARDLVYRTIPAPQFADMQYGWVGRPSLEMLITRDGGEHWEVLELDALPQGIEQIQFVNSRVGWGLMKNEEVFSTLICQTTDGGKTWTRLIPTTF
jgi:photosystem II stability/assembly factor-like uncharacterized protein